MQNIYYYIGSHRQLPSAFHKSQIKNNLFLAASEFFISADYWMGEDCLWFRAGLGNFCQMQDWAPLERLQAEKGQENPKKMEEPLAFSKVVGQGNY